MKSIAKGIQKNTMLLALVFVMVLFQILIVATGKGSLFRPSNINNLIIQNSYVVILATGMLMCILTGGNIDLSVGSVVALVGAIAGVLIVENKTNIYVAMIVCLLAGLLLGAFQGGLIAYLQIPPFIVTLAGMLIFRGIALTILQGQTISPFPPEYTRYFNSHIPMLQDTQSPEARATMLTVSLAVGVIAVLVYIVTQIFQRIKKTKKGYDVEHIGLFLAKTVTISLVLIVICWLLGQAKGIPIILVTLAIVVFAYNYYTSKTVPGRHLYAMGGNAKAAQLSGINTKKTLFFAYANMGFLAAIAALICVARFNSAAPSAGDGYEMDAIASCYIGGASAYGGVGKVSGAVIGAIFMGVLNNGMSILGINADIQLAVKGGVLLLAVIVDVLTKRRRVAA